LCYFDSEEVKKKEMGLVGVQENGNGEVGLSIGTKNKYRRMDSEVTEDFDDGSHHHHQEKRSSSTRKYVLACAIFASLNSVLLGYGNQALIFFFFPFEMVVLLLLFLFLLS
jgi:hypothetical protein